MPYTPAVSDVENTFSCLFNLPLVGIFTEWTDNRVSPMTLNPVTGGDTIRVSPITIGPKRYGIGCHFTLDKAREEEHD